MSEAEFTELIKCSEFWILGNSANSASDKKAINKCSRKPRKHGTLAQDQKEQQPGQHIDRTAIERDRLRAKFREEEKNIVQEFLSECGGEQKISETEYRVGELYDVVEYLIDENLNSNWNSLVSKVGLSN